jgi:hypothetical protein
VPGRGRSSQLAARERARAAVATRAHSRPKRREP